MLLHSLTFFLLVIYRFDFKEMKDGMLNIEEVRRLNVKNFDPTKFKVQQLFATSKDGTKIPMFVTHRADIQLNGENPTILDGYGGFNVSEVPYFAISRSMWLAQFNGGVALSCIRGGGAYGSFQTFSLFNFIYFQVKRGMKMGCFIRNRMFLMTSLLVLNI